MSIEYFLVFFSIMSDIAPHSSDLTQQLNQVLEYYFSEHYREKCYLGLVFQQGKRKMVQINVPAHDLPTLLQAKPSTGKYLGKINYILASKIVQHFFNVSEEALSVFIGAKFNPFIF
jgi:hypothetical protein